MKVQQKRLIFVLSCAALVRLVYLYQAQGTPLYEVLLIDSDFYHREALHIVAGNWLGDAVFFMNPFYAYFLALVYSLLGAEPFWAALFQVAMGTASCALVYGIASLLWGERAGLCGAGLMACYGVLVFYDGSLLTATPILFLNLCALYALLRWENGGRAHWLYMAGLALGLSATARPTVLLFAMVLASWCIGQAGSWRAGLRAWVQVCLAIGLVVAPVAVRNYAMGGEWGLTTSAMGMNFYVGNHPGATGIYAQVDFLSSAEPEKERDEFIREAQRRTQTNMTPAQASRYWFGRGLAYISEQPLDYAALLLRKTYMFFSRVEAQNNLSFYFARDFVPLLHWVVVGWWLVAPLALGYWVSASPQQRVLLLDLYFACYLAACLLFFVSSEYRLPVVPILALYAGRLIDRVAGYFKEHRLHRAVPVAVAVVLFALPINYADAFAKRLTYRRVDYYNFGVLYERRGAMVRAEGMFRGALNIDAGFAPARAGLARVQAATGRLDSEHMLDIESLAPLVEQALKWYGTAQYERALPLFERAITMDSERSELQNNLGLTYYKLGRLAAAEGRFARALELDSTYAKAHFNLGLVRVAQGDFDGAERAYAHALQIVPNYKQALYKRGELAREQGQREQALLYWERLLLLLGEDVSLAARIDSLRRKH